MPPPPLLSVSVLTGFACIIYLLIICCFAHSHQRNDHFKVKSKRLLKLERGGGGGGTLGGRMRYFTYSERRGQRFTFGRDGK